MLLFESVKILGNSGCRIELILQEELLVRKTALDSIYAVRLAKQRDKQLRFKTPIPGIVTPKIIDYDDFSFTMQHLIMLDSVDFFERATPTDIYKRMELLINFLVWEFQNSSPNYIPKNLFEEKIYSIERQVPSNIWQSYFVNFANYALSTLPTLIDIPVGICHGDLTLSNIMFSTENISIGFIDFLDSFIDSPLIDLVKLRQDTYFSWTSHRYPLSHDSGKIKIINNWIDKIILNDFKDQIQTPSYKIIEFINFLRIAPYLKNREDLDYLYTSLQKIQKTMEK